MSTVAEPDAEDPGEPVHLTISIPEDPSLGDAEILPPPLSAEETRALRDAFSWEATTPLRETDREGRPILHYALVYVTSREAHEALTQLDLHHSYLPLFESERARWDGMSGVFTNEGDGRGVFAFALLPAALINAERTLALAGELAFDAILVRDVPEPAARARDGGVSYEWLRSEHFLYNGRAYVPPASAGDSDVGGAREALGGGLANRLATNVANLAEAGVEAVRRAVGAFFAWWNGSARINVMVTPLNTDPSFVTGTPMLQGWGTDRGRILRIEGQPVHVSQGFSLFVATTNAIGVASMLVERDEHAMVCVESEAPAAYVTRLLVPAALCSATVTPRATAGMFVNLQIQAIEMNVLAQIDDARGYVGEIHGRTPRQPKVGVGGAADVVTLFNGGRAFAPCFDLGVIPPIDLLGTVFGPLTTTIEFLLDYDIMIPTSDSDRSRGVPTHEYGHFVFCDMLEAEGAYYNTWVPMIVQGLTQEPGDSGSQLNEAFADFISSQVTGSVNAFQTETMRTPQSGNGDTLGFQWYCDPRSSVCVDDNIGGPALSALAPLGQVATTAEITAGGGLDPLFTQRSARMMTTIADAFDGHATGGNVPGNGAAWTFNAFGNFVPPIVDSAPLDDESITLAAAPGARGNGGTLHQVVRAFAATSGATLDVQFFRGMTHVMRTAGYTDTEICELYLLHEPGGPCPAAFFDTPPDIRPSAPIDLIHTLTAPNTASWSWRDVSPVAGANFDFEVVTESSPSSPFPPGTVPFPPGTRTYATPQTFGPQSLLPFYDTPIVFRVRTVSTSMRESAWTEDRLWTLAEPARLPRATGTSAGMVPLEWDPVIATSYGVVVTDASGRRVEVDRVTSPSYTLDMFDGGIVTVEIVSYNFQNVPSAASPPLRLIRDPAPALHVAPGGDDTATGGPTTPLATIAAALALAADSFDVATIRVAGILPYTYTTGPLTVPPGLVVQIEGGYPATSWVRTDKLTLVVASTGVLPGSRGCGAPFDVIPTGDWAAGVRVEAGARLYLDQIDLTVTPVDARCTAAVALESGWLDLRASAIAVRSGAGDVCAVGVLGDRATPELPRLAAHSSIIRGATEVDLANPAVQVAAVCMNSADSVLLEDTTLTGGSGTVSLLRARSASGLVLTQSHSLDVVRSTITSVTPGPRGSEGAQTGVLLQRMLGAARITNSVVRTARGSNSNTAISAHSLGGTGSLALFYVTALTGDDYDRTAPLPLDHRSAPIALSGALGSVRILNSILANGAGLGDPTLQTVIAGIDRGTDRMTADPRTFELRGTAISFPFRSSTQSEALSYCEPDAGRFTGGIYDEATLNSNNHRCYPIVGASSYTASGNLAFNGDPDDVAGSTRPAARFDTTGRPTSTAPIPPATEPGTIAIDALRIAGVDLTSEPVTVPETLTLDIDRVVRMSMPPGAGAWVLP